MSVTSKDLQDYLYETDAIEEAEELLLKDILKRQEKQTKLKETQNKVQNIKRNQQEKLTKDGYISALKISDLLEELEKVDPIGTNLTSKTKKEEEIKREDEQQNQVNSSQEMSANSSYPTNEANQTNVEPITYQIKQINIDANDKLQRELKALHDNYRDKLNKQKTQSINVQYELEMLKQTKKWSNKQSLIFNKDNSLVSKDNLGSLPLSTNESSLDFPLNEGEQQPIVKTKQQTRVENILSNVLKEDYVQEKIQQIEQLRNISQERNLYDIQEDLFTTKPSLEQQLLSENNLINPSNNIISNRSRSGSYQPPLDPMNPHNINNPNNIILPPISSPSSNKLTNPSLMSLDLPNNNSNNSNNIILPPISSPSSKKFMNPNNNIQPNEPGQISRPRQPSFSQQQPQQANSYPASYSNYQQPMPNSFPPSSSSSSYPQPPYNQPLYNQLPYNQLPSYQQPYSQPYNQLPYNQPYNQLPYQQLPHYNQPYPYPQLNYLNPMMGNNPMYMNPNNIPNNNTPLSSLELLANQLELENMQLQSALGNNNSNNSNENNGLGALNPLNMFPSQPMLPSSMPYRNNPLVRDINNISENNIPSYFNHDTQRRTRDEFNKQKEINNIKYELEKLKQLKELEDFQLEYDKHKKQQLQEKLYEEELQTKQYELMQIKLQQRIEKEKRLLQLQSNNNNGPNDNNNNLNNNNDLENDLCLEPMKLEVREDCGVLMDPIVFTDNDSIQGITVIVDGLLMASTLITSMDLYRFALGIYDKQGRSLVRLIATDWRTLTIQPNNPTVLELISPTLYKSLKLKDIGKDKLDKNEELLGIKCLLELQVKDPSLPAQQRSIGWSILPLFTLKSSDKLYINNNLWRIPLRKGISDPTIDPKEVSLDTNLFLQENTSSSECCFLIRVLDQNELTRGINWHLNEQYFANDIGQLCVHYLQPYEKILTNFTKSMKSVKPSQAGGPMRPQPSQVSFLPQEPNSRPSSCQTTNSSNNPPMLKPSPSLVGNLAPIDESIKIKEEEKDPEISQLALKSVKAKDLSVNYWYLGKSLGPCTTQFKLGDGIDIYIDGGRFLPENTTISRVSLRVFSATKEQIGNVHECFSKTTSPSTSPMYQYKAEYRHLTFPSSCLLLFRVDTIDSTTLQPSCVGYSMLPLFATRDRRPITLADISSSVDVFLNTGNYQLPMYFGRLPTYITSFSEDTLSKYLQRLPCSTLLIRILPAPKSYDQLTTLSCNEFPPEEWFKLKLMIPVPDYSLGEYYGGYCEPNTVERIAYQAKQSIQQTKTTESALLQAVKSTPNATDLPPQPIVNPNDPQTIDKYQKWWKSLLPSVDNIRRLIDIRYAIPYNVEGGLDINILGLYNMPDINAQLAPFRGLNALFTSNNTTNNTTNPAKTKSQPSYLYKVIYSLSPPGLFYRDSPLFDQVYTTKNIDLESQDGITQPKYTDGFMRFTPIEMSPKLYLLIEIQVIKIESSDGKKMKVSLVTPTMVNNAKIITNYWSFLPLSMEKFKNDGYAFVQSGFYQMPLFEGKLPYQEFFLDSNNPLQDISVALTLKKPINPTNNNTNNNNLNNLALLSTKTKQNITPLKLVSTGSSIFIQVINPLIKPLLLTEMIQTNNNQPNTNYLIYLIENACKGLTGNNAIIDKFMINSVLSLDNKDNNNNINNNVNNTTNNPNNTNNNSNNNSNGNNGTITNKAKQKELNSILFLLSKTFPQILQDEQWPSILLEIHEHYQIILGFRS